MSSFFFNIILFLVVNAECISSFIKTLILLYNNVKI